jgi:hypothetical protein
MFTAVSSAFWGRTAAARRLYQIEAKALPGRNDTAADTLRFQQSLVFTDGGSNRSADTIRAIREACRGSAFNPAGVDDPRCRRPKMNSVRRTGHASSRIVGSLSRCCVPGFTVGFPVGPG